MTDQSKQKRDETAERLLYASMYASYANHCAIQKKIPLTYISWKKAGKPKSSRGDAMTDQSKQQTERCDYITDSPYFKGQMLKCNLPMGHDGQHILIADHGSRITLI